MRPPVTASAGLAALLLLGLASGGPAGATGRPGSDPGPTRPTVLAEAAALFDDRGAGAGGRPAAPSRDATLTLLQLSNALDELDRDDRDEARRILARPTDPGSTFPETRYDAAAVVETRCATRSCLHWVETTADAVPLADADLDGLPDWAETSLAVTEQVLAGIVDERGYRPPMDDSAAAEHGPDGLLDVYLTNLGDDGYYGYCVSEPVPGSPNRATPGYCVVDNDFSVAEFGGVPLEVLQVTVAHEVFHAVQFGYDAGDDHWLLEGGAAWMEEQLFDHVDDNRAYLADSPLAFPQMPVDYATPVYYTYGSWSFVQLLTERFGGDPTFMREVWERADDGPGGGGQYGMQALAGVLAERGFPLPEAVAAYGAANLTPATSYEEGRHFPVARPVKAFRLTRAKPDPGWWSAPLSHLSNATFRYTPARSLPRRAKLRVVLDLPRRSRGSLAHVVVTRRGGATSRVPVSLDRKGDGRRTVAFSRRKVRRVDVVLTNASARYSCGRGTLLSCAGDPLDDFLTHRVRARALRR